MTEKTRAQQLTHKHRDLVTRLGDLKPRLRAALTAHEAAKVENLVDPTEDNAEVEIAALREAQALTTEETILEGDLVAIKRALGAEQTRHKQQALEDTAERKQWIQDLADERVSMVEEQFRDCLAELIFIATVRSPHQAISADGVRRRHAPDHELLAYRPMIQDRYTPEQEIA